MCNDLIQCIGSLRVFSRTMVGIASSFKLETVITTWTLLNLTITYFNALFYNSFATFRAEVNTFLEPENLSR